MKLDGATASFNARIWIPGDEASEDLRTGRIGSRG